MSIELPLSLKVNGEDRNLTVPPWMSLADMLRERLHLAGTRIGCNEGVCGTCTVLLDSVPVRACLTLAAQADGAVVETVEAYADDPGLRAIQQAFVDHHAAQCGFCTSGMLAIVRAFLDDRTIADHGEEAVIRRTLDAVLCRCTGYQPIVAAVKALAARREGRADG
ncbi:(2Fe-2S)-binding protein [Niveispirillum fermenti]|uniref:(2Fe-2S)-binding protein n=1 Tax=Niveispirillum fermenti TaxID=1233113 RepID=UPI003A856DD2